VYDALGGQPGIHEELERMSMTSSSAGALPQPTISDGDWAAYASDPGWTINTNGMARLVFLETNRKRVLSCRRHNDPHTCGVNMVAAIVDAFGMMPSDWLSSAWEIMPYSFVIDWFVDSQRLVHPLAREVFRSDNLDMIGYSESSDVLFRLEYLPGRPWTYVGFNWAGTMLDPVYVGLPGHTRRYSRTGGLPASESIITNQGLSVIHLIDGLMLTLNRL